MRFASICSGIEAASVAFDPLGWRAAWFSEIEPFPCAVLKSHYPDIPNHGDMLGLVEKILSGEIEAPEGLFGGTPCQGFSFAGLRGSLSDARSNLSLTFCEIANAIDTVRGRSGMPGSIIGWENVPGVLSTSDNAFGCFIGGLVGNDAACEPGPRPDEGKSNRFWKWKKPKGFDNFLHVPKWPSAGCAIGPVRRLAWRILDAQYDGLAQRRERLFVVASSRNGFDPAEILFVEEGLRRDHPPERESRKAVTYDVAPCLDASSVGFSRIGDKRGQDPVIPTWWDGSDISQTLDAVLSKGQTMPEKNRFPAVLVPVTSNGDSVAPTLDASHDKKWGSNQWVTSGFGVIEPVAHTLRGDGFDASEDGSGRGTPIVPVLAFDCKRDGSGADEVATPLRALNHSESHANGGGQLPVAQAVPVSFNFHKSGSDRSSLGVDVDQTSCLRAFDKSPLGVDYAQGPRFAVRRLTPRECERLQGFPDDYTKIAYRGKPAEKCPDGPRYKAIGNSWAVPVVRWIGRKIDEFLKGQECQA